jgi:hypothetical protein
VHQNPKTSQVEFLQLLLFVSSPYVFFLEKCSVLFFFYLAVHGIQIGILVSFSIYLLLYENMIASFFGLLIFTVILLTKIYIL